MTTYRSLNQPLIFNTGAVREELKQGLKNYLFLTCWLRERNRQEGEEPELLRAGVDIRPCKNTGQRQIEVINFRDLAEQPDSKMVGFPCASLTYCIGLYEDKVGQGRKASDGKPLELGYFRKLAEVTLGDITGTSYKLLQLYMQDLLLNLPGLGDAERGDGLCQLLKI